MLAAEKSVLKSVSHRPRESLSRAQARRVLLAAQGLAQPRPGLMPERRLDRRHLDRVFDRVGLLQIDSVNVLVRSHYLPVFARLGPYPHDLLDRHAWGRRAGLFEYWGHEASLIPVQLQPLFRWRMAKAAAGKGIYTGLAAFGRERRTYIETVLQEVRARGPLSARELSDGGRSSGSWWGWSDGKRALEWLFWAGLVTTAGRRNFERIYDLPERVLPGSVLDAPTPPEAEAQRGLIEIAARALGVATSGCLRDYFRLPAAAMAPRVAELVEEGALVPVTVEGWDRPAWMHRDARLPRRVAARALLSPFDSLVWRRERGERAFDFSYRLELYTPAHKRQFGYYVLPFLFGERLAARLDLKADRAGGRLLVGGSFGEPGLAASEVAPALGDELQNLAAWLGLRDIEVAGRGDLAAPLANALGDRPHG